MVKAAAIISLEVYLDSTGAALDELGEDFEHVRHVT